PDDARHAAPAPGRRTRPGPPRGAGAGGPRRLAGCTTIKGWFGGKTSDALKPAALTDFTPSATAQRLWTVDLGGGEGAIGSRQGPAVVDGRVYAASLEGGISAIDLQSGNRLWHFETE